MATLLALPIGTTIFLFLFSASLGQNDQSPYNSPHFVGGRAGKYYFTDNNARTILKYDLAKAEEFCNQGGQLQGELLKFESKDEVEYLASQEVLGWLGDRVYWTGDKVRNNQFSSILKNNASGCEFDVADLIETDPSKSSTSCVLFVAKPNARAVNIPCDFKPAASLAGIFYPLCQIDQNLFSDEEREMLADLVQKP